jgi:hypothetical protein
VDRQTPVSFRVLGVACVPASGWQGLIALVFSGVVVFGSVSFG